jgi:alpha-L-arabinofuranosidase
VVSDPYGSAGQSVPALDALATYGPAGWRLALVNRDPERSVECRLFLAAQPMTGTFPATVLAGDSVDAYNDIASPDRVVPVSTQVAVVDGVCLLSPHSLTVLQLG